MLCFISFSVFLSFTLKTLYATTDKLQDSKADKTDIEIQLSTVSSQYLYRLNSFCKSLLILPAEMIKEAYDLTFYG